MITILATMLALQAAPMAISQAVPMPTAEQSAGQPLLIATPPEVRQGSMVSKGRALVARADRVRAHFSPTSAGPSKAEIDALRDQAKAELDSLSEMSEQDQLQLQMAMDRLSKAMSVLSNVLKKYDDTAKTILGNMK